MNNFKSYLKQNNVNIGFIVLTLICLIFLCGEIINDRFWLSDFEVYYKAASRILQSQNLYKIAEDGHYIFKYSPTSAIYFIPFVLFPFGVAKVFYWLLLTAIIVKAFFMSIKLIKPELIIYQKSKFINILVISAMLIIAIHFLRELHLGQVNYLLLFLYIVAINFYIKQKGIAFSIILAITIFIKPFTLIFVPYLILNKKHKELLWFLIFVVGLFLLPFIFYGSIETTMEQYSLWLSELQIELSNKQGLLDYSNHTIASVMARYTPIRLLVGNSVISFIYQLLLLSGIGFVFLWFTRMNSKTASLEQQKYYSVIDLSVLVALIPLLAFTSENAFLFSQLIVFIILIHFKFLKQYEKIIAIVGFIFIGANFSELLGGELSQKIDNFSLLPIGMILLIYIVFSLRKNKHLLVSVNKKTPCF